MSLFERWLSIWVLPCIAAGIALGQWFFGAFETLGYLELARVNIPVGVLIWLVIIPMLAITLFGFDSGAALATVAGVLVEVPVMLSAVGIVNRSQGWYERGAARTAQAP